MEIFSLNPALDIDFKPERGYTKSSLTIAMSAKKNPKIGELAVNR